MNSTTQAVSCQYAPRRRGVTAAVVAGITWAMLFVGPAAAEQRHEQDMLWRFPLLLGPFEEIILGDDRLWDWRGGQLAYDGGTLTHDLATFVEPADFFVDPDQDSFLNRLWLRELDVDQLWFTRLWDKNIVHANAVADPRNPHHPHPMLDLSSVSLLEDVDAWNLYLGYLPQRHLQTDHPAHPLDEIMPSLRVGLRNYRATDWQAALGDRRNNGANANSGSTGWDGVHAGALRVQDDFRLLGSLNLVPNNFCYRRSAPIPNPEICTGYITSYTAARDAVSNNRTPVQVRDRHGFATIVPFGGGADFGVPIAYFDVMPNRSVIVAHNVNNVWPADYVPDDPNIPGDQSRWDPGDAGDQTEHQGQPWDYDVVMGSGHTEGTNPRMQGRAGFDRWRDVELHTQDIVVQAQWGGSRDSNGDGEVRCADGECGAWLKPYGITMGAQYYHDESVTDHEGNSTFDVDGDVNQKEGGFQNPYRGNRRVAWPFGGTRIVREQKSSSADPVIVEATCPYNTNGTHPAYYQPYLALTDCSQEIESGAATAILRGVQPYRSVPPGAYPNQPVGDQRCGQNWETDCVPDSDPYNDSGWHSKPVDVAWTEVRHVSRIKPVTYDENTVGCRATFSNPNREAGVFIAYAYCSDTGRRKLAPNGPLVPPGGDYANGVWP